MTLTTTYPGIYVSENNEPAFSVSPSATAIPLFAFGTTNPPAGENIQLYNNWADFSATQEPQTDSLWYSCLSLWFKNGGGKCYLVAVASLVECVSHYDDITLVVAAGNDIFAEFNTVSSGGYNVFGLFDGPQDKIELSSSVTVDTVMNDFPATPYAAAYYPWVATEPNGTAIPPSAVAAAAIAQTDRTRGVWKAPANMVVNGVIPLYPVNDELQGSFTTGKALNMIRSFPNRGTTVWGARTLEDSDLWRYIPVRRLFNSVEIDVKKALNILVFEPNSQPTWQRVKAAVDNYLYNLWRQGALAGNKSEEAYFVQVGKGITMSDDDINQGKMIVNVGLAAVRPAEFIILQFTQNMAE